METTFQDQDRLHYAEVYASDILELKNIFLQKFKVINEHFGIPFLLVKKKGETVAFASLILNQNNGIDFKIYDKQGFNEEEKEAFITKARNYFKRNHSENFRNQKQLKSSIQQMISWLND